MPINSYEFGEAWPQDSWPPYYSGSHPDIHITFVDSYIGVNATGGTNITGGSTSGLAYGSASSEVGNSGSYPVLGIIYTNAAISTTTTVESSGVTWDLYTTSYSTGSTTASTTAVSSTTSSVETETIITTSGYSLTLDSSETAASDEIIYGTFLTASAGFSGPISDLSTTSSILLSYGSREIATDHFYYISYTNLDFIDTGSDYGQTWIYDNEDTYLSSSKTTRTISGQVPFQGGMMGSPLLSWSGTTWGSGDDIYLAESSYGTDLQPSGILTASAHPRIREAISYSEYTSGYFISGDSVIYQTTTSQLSVVGSADSSVSTSGIVGFSELDFTTFDIWATLAGGQEWSVSYFEGPTSGAFLAITNGSDGSSSTTFTVGTDFSSVISCASDANVVLEPLLMAQPPITYFTDSDGSTSSGYPDGTYWIG